MKPESMHHGLRNACTTGPVYAEGVFTLHRLEGNAMLSITFVANASTPNTGDNTYPHLIFCSIVAVASFLGIAILLTVNRKKSTNK